MKKQKSTKEEQGFIEIKISKPEHNFSPKDLDILEIKEMISDVEAFLYPTQKEKKNRPHISYDLKEGSAIHKFFLPVSAVILFNGLIKEITSRNSLNFLDYKRQSIIDKLQRKAHAQGVTIAFGNSLYPGSSFVLDSTTTFKRTSPAYYDSEFYIYGEIYQEGGKTPNLHLASKKYGNLVIAATKAQLMEGEKRTYKVYGVKVRGKKSLDDDKVFDLKLIEYLTYTPRFNRALLDNVIEKASQNLSKISNVDTWINDLRAEGV